MQVLKAAFGLEVHWDGDSTINIYLEETYANMTCGLCGNFNDDVNDDFTNPDGVIVSGQFLLLF